MRNPTLIVLAETEDSSEQVRRATAGLRPRPEVVWCPSFDAVDGMKGPDAPFDVLIAGPIVSNEEGLRHLREIRGRAPDGQLILALDRWRSTSLRDTVRTGALDVLRLQVTDDDLRDAVEQALAFPSSSAAGPSDRRAADPKQSSQGAVIAVVSATGGCGKTFLATNLAYHLQSQAKKQTCLIDLDLQFGELATALRLKPRRTIHHLLAHHAEGDELGRRLEEHLERHESGILLLSAPEEPAQADAIDSADIAGVIDAARSRFDFVIVDTPAALSESVVVAVEQADQILAIATLDLPSVRNLGIMLSTLKKLQVPTEKIQLLLNKVEPDVGIDVARVERYFPQGFSMVIPYGREVNRSLNMGQPVLAYAPRGDVSKALTAGLSHAVAVDPDDGDAVAEPKARRRLSWPGRKSA